MDRFTKKQIFFFSIILLFLINGCGIPAKLGFEKRLYRHGYYAEGGSNSAPGKQTVSKKAEIPVANETTVPDSIPSTSIKSEEEQPVKHSSEKVKHTSATSSQQNKLVSELNKQTGKQQTKKSKGLNRQHNNDRQKQHYYNDFEDLGTLILYLAIAIVALVAWCLISLFPGLPIQFALLIGLIVLIAIIILIAYLVNNMGD